MSTVSRNYLDMHRKGAFLGLPGFLKSRKHSQTPREIRKELEAIDSWTLHRPITLHPRTRKTLCFYPNFIYSCDLMSTQNMAKYNKNINFLLVSVDSYTRELYIAKLLDKSADSMVKGFKSICRQSKHWPKFILCDDVSKFSYFSLKLILFTRR